LADHLDLKDTLALSLDLLHPTYNFVLTRLLARRATVHFVQLSPAILRMADLSTSSVGNSKPIDEPFTDAELTEFSFQGFRDRVIRLSRKKNPTVRDFISISGRGTIKEHPMFCGSPKQVADQMEEWFTAPACDGFVLAASDMPGAYDDVVRLLVPELQRRFIPEGICRPDTA
jgi:alkanesulfonate monooxygenase SsuD/methylene tetrahydromethanopterin reductase-like flavin-dependent oxidoreductase (luciferase family)